MKQDAFWRVCSRPFLITLTQWINGSWFQQCSINNYSLIYRYFPYVSLTVFLQQMCCMWETFKSLYNGNQDYRFIIPDTDHLWRVCSRRLAKSIVGKGNEKCSKRAISPLSSMKPIIYVILYGVFSMQATITSWKR